MYKRLGELVDYSEPQFIQVGTSTSFPYSSYILYGVEAKYTNGTAYLNWTLANLGNDQLKVWSLKINSDVFIVPLEDIEDTLSEPQNENI